MIDYAFCKMRVLWYVEENENKDKRNHEGMFLLEKSSLFLRRLLKFMCFVYQSVYFKYFNQLLNVKVSRYFQEKNNWMRYLCEHAMLGC